MVAVVIKFAYIGMVNTLIMQTLFQTEKNTINLPFQEEETISEERATKSHQVGFCWKVFIHWMSWSLNWPGGPLLCSRCASYCTLVLVCKLWSRTLVVKGTYSDEITNHPSKIRSGSHRLHVRVRKCSCCVWWRVCVCACACACACVFVVLFCFRGGFFHLNLAKILRAERPTRLKLVNLFQVLTSTSMLKISSAAH